ncbi:hypothetical protein LXA43DRAFT_952565 [Ganoderma leucocontextum]|nr:hypothetical protein LXA43DRAFT_952565 [Ganoderma leucocontextum]
MQSLRLPLLQSRPVAPPGAPTRLADLTAWRPYLDVLRAPHRVAVARLLASEHPLAVEVLRRAPYEVPRHRRICRFCKHQHCIEDEHHALFVCGHASLASIRGQFFDALHEQFQVNMTYLLRFSPMPIADILHVLLTREDALPLVAEYVHDVFHAVQLEPLLVLRSDEEWAQYATVHA